MSWGAHGVMGWTKVPIYTGVRCPVFSTTALQDLDLRPWRPPHSYQFPVPLPGGLRFLGFGRCCALDSCDRRRLLGCSQSASAWYLWKSWRWLLGFWVFFCSLFFTVAFFEVHCVWGGKTLLRQRLLACRGCRRFERWVSQTKKTYIHIHLFIHIYIYSYYI